MKNTNSLNKYLKLRGKSITQAANEIGCSRQYLHMLLDGTPAGKKVARQIENWSDGYVPAVELMRIYD